jgi:hypothetical protein
MKAIVKDVISVDRLPQFLPASFLPCAERGTGNEV